MMSKISVIIPVHNGGDSFRQCLSSLTNAVTPETEVIVVADGDTDGSWLIAKEWGAKVLRIPVCGGPAQARNVGAQAATGDILFFVDADVAVYPQTLMQVQTAFRDEPHLTALIGSYDDSPGASNFLSQYKNLLNHYMHQTASRDASTFWGACGAVRRKVFLAMGGFDKSYLWMEDVELGHRLKKAGYQIRLDKELQVKHLKFWGTASLLKSDFFHRALPWTELIWRDTFGAKKGPERPSSKDLNLGVSSRLSVICVYLLLSVLLVSWWLPHLLLVAGVLSLLLLVFNLPVYRFFLSKRGLWFALGVIPWHWFYYFYGGLGFAVGTGRYLLRQQYSPRTIV